MGVQDRDWYRDWWRKRTGYTERASFRVGHGERLRSLRRSAWRRNWVIAGAVVLVLVVLAIVR